MRGSSNLSFRSPSVTGYYGTAGRRRRRRWGLIPFWMSMCLSFTSPLSGAAAESLLLRFRRQQHRPREVRAGLGMVVVGVEDAPE